MRPLSLACLFLLVVVAGCDTADVQEYMGVIEVSLAPETSVADLALRLVAVEDMGCERPLTTSFESEAATRRVVVEGLGVDDRTAVCTAIIPAAATVPLRLGPELPGVYVVEVEHAGETDLYRLDLAGTEPVLAAVRASTTRLAPDRSEGQ
ncbi:hypothetical protein [Rubrivirga sp.]|uniref:hypothetical protein n=1 Tax=Rubrivirga sp. TaxID=1885344 RepID=UPI003B521360